MISLNGEQVDKGGEKEVCPAETTSYELVIDMGINVIRLVTEVVVAQEKPKVTEDFQPPLDGKPAYEHKIWVTTGGPPGGLGYDIRMDPRNPDIMYVTDAQTGVFKSTDGGATWFAINNGITTRAGYSGTAIPVFSLSLDPNNPDIVWAGTQYSSGIYKSEDGGTSWMNMNDGENGIIEKSISVRGITVEPGNSQVIYFAGEVSSWEWNGETLPGLGLDKTKGVVYKSSDGGLNWKRIWYGDNLTRYIWINPVDTNILYVSTGIFDREAANSNAESRNPGGVGILKSTDGGVTWRVLNDSNGFRSEELYFGSLFMHPKNPEILLAAAGNDPFQTLLGKPIGAIYLTGDGGENWERVLELSNASVVEICLSDPSTMYAGSINGIYRSDDGGRTWNNTAQRLWGTPDVVAGFPIDMQCDPRDPMRIFINNYIGGNFVSTDGGVSWSLASKGYTGAMQKQVATLANSKTVYTAGRMGIFKSDDLGESWVGTGHGVARIPEGIVVAVNPSDSRQVLAVLQDGGPDPKFSNDGGVTWINLLTGLWNEGEFPFESITRIEYSNNDPNYVVASAGNFTCRIDRQSCEISPGLGLIHSFDGGKTWSRTSLEEGQVIDFEITGDGVLFAALYPSTIMSSSDRGQTWEILAEGISNPIPETFIDINMPKPYILSLAVDPYNHDHLLAGFERGGIMQSMDGGKKWEHFSPGMAPETTIIDIEMDPYHEGVMYAGSLNSGMYYLSPQQEHWMVLNQGLTIQTVMDISLTYEGSTLFIATDGGGVYRMGPQ